MAKKMSVEDTERLLAEMDAKNALTHQRRLARIDEAEAQALKAGKQPFDVDAIARLRRIYRDKDGRVPDNVLVDLRDDYYCRFPEARTLAEYVAARRELDARSSEH